MPISIDKIFYAYRQAKNSLFFEKRGVGLLGLADFESNLPERLWALQSALPDSGAWFDHLSLGQAWIVPKKLTTESRQVASSRDAMPGDDNHEDKALLEIQTRLTPTPDFAIAEVLYLWQFGPILQQIIGKESVGYRLDLRDKRVRSHARWLFEYWPARYEQYRVEPMEIARKELANSNNAIEIISGDLESFYDTVDASFMLSDSFVQKLVEKARSTGLNFDPAEYRTATESLIRKYREFHVNAANKTGLDWSLGIPIGALTSRVVANLALSTLDEYIIANKNVVSYRRYVDDFVIVARTDPHRTSLKNDRLMSYLPVADYGHNRINLDVEELNRLHCDFSLQMEKCKVHVLSGDEDGEFIRSIQEDFMSLISEGRAFVHDSILNGTIDRRVVRAGTAENDRVRVLRDADRAKLHRLELSTALASLDKVSRLVETSDARGAAKRTLARTVPLVANRRDWVEHLGLAMRTMQLALVTGDEESAKALIDRTDALWGTVDRLQESVGVLSHRGRRIRRQRAWTWLRNYLHELRLEAICCAMPSAVSGAENRFLNVNGLIVRSKTLKKRALGKRAARLAASDLRKMDREDDQSGVTEEEWSWNDEWILGHEESLDSRIKEINRFVEVCESLGDLTWRLPASRLFLCTRPPAYFDIARRYLYRIETREIEDNLFEDLLTIVNSVRGTDYVDPVGNVVKGRTVSVNGDGGRNKDASVNPRLILGNLVTHDDAFAGAATPEVGNAFGSPKLTLDRLIGLGRVLDKAYDAARDAQGRKSLLVLPELSLPRQWFRDVAKHVVAQGRFGLVAGLEYLHDPTHKQVYNQVFSVMPGPFGSVATWPWTKRRPAKGEEKELAKFGVTFPTFGASRRRIVVHGPYGRLSVLICSELIEARRVADLLARVELLVAPSWNTDTASYDHLIQSVGLQLHSIVGIANNGHYSDCRVWAPHSVRWKRDLCRLIERDSNDVVFVDLPLDSLRAHHRGNSQDEWRPLPPDWSLWEGA